jgi:hypothetical protein
MSGHIRWAQGLEFRLLQRLLRTCLTRSDRQNRIDAPPNTPGRAHNTALRHLYWYSGKSRSKFYRGGTYCAGVVKHMPLSQWPTLVPCLHAPTQGSPPPNAVRRVPCLAGRSQSSHRPLRSARVRSTILRRNGERPCLLSPGRSGARSSRSASRFCPARTSACAKGVVSKLAATTPAFAGDSLAEATPPDRGSRPLCRISGSGLALSADQSSALLDFSHSWQREFEMLTR